MWNKFQEKTTKAALARAVAEGGKKFKAEGHTKIRVVFLEKIDLPIVHSVFEAQLNEEGIAFGLLSPKGDRLKANLLMEFNDPKALWFEVVSA